MKEENKGMFVLSLIACVCVVVVGLVALWKIAQVESAYKQSENDYRQCVQTLFEASR
jgi:hypothetical protein